MIYQLFINTVKHKYGKYGKYGQYGKYGKTFIKIIPLPASCAVRIP